MHNHLNRHKVDDSLDAVTAGEDHDNSDEDCGNIEISSLSAGWVGEQQCLLLDSLVDYQV